MQKSVKRLSKETMKKVPLMKNITSGHWSLNLLTSMNDPDSILEEDEHIVVIKDKYPKAHHHYLVLPKKDILAISKTTLDDLELLKHMESIAYKYVNRHKEYEFQVGYHSLPSMQRLHLHVISTDFDSPGMRTKHHWNSFTTPYFLSSRDARKQLQEYGRININTKDNEEYLKKPLRCHICYYFAKNMPELKNHILQHIPK